MIITDDNVHELINPVVDGKRKAHGLIQRDYRKNPYGSLMYAKPFSMPIIPKSEWQSRLDEQTTKLSHIRNIGKDGKQIPALDQNDKGYCWAHSTTAACLLVRALNNQPFVDLSAYAVACKIKDFKDEGGWGAQSLEFIAETGIPDSNHWPHQSMNRSNDNPATWANAARHKVTRWMDLDPYSMLEQFVTCLLLNIPVVADYNWWGHSVCAIDLISLTPLTVLILNSWGNSWGKDGTGELQGIRALPDGAIAPLIMTA